MAAGGGKDIRGGAGVGRVVGREGRDEEGSMMGGW